MKHESVNHPSHYNSGKIEVIEAIEDWKLGMHLGNAVKYIARAGKKDPNKFKEDLSKAVWYIQRQIEILSDNPRRPNDMNKPKPTPEPTDGMRYGKNKPKPSITYKTYVAPSGKNNVRVYQDEHIEFFNSVNPEAQAIIEQNIITRIRMLKKELGREPTTIEVFEAMSWKELK